MEQQFLIRAFRSPVPVCKTGADGAILELSNFEPGRPLDITGGLFNACRLNTAS
jgi:hypothetical protein